jgi:hypothetical protein
LPTLLNANVPLPVPLVSWIVPIVVPPSVNATEPEGLATPLTPVTVAVNVTLPPLATLPGAAESATVGVARLTVSANELLAAPVKLLSPP